MKRIAIVYPSGYIVTCTMDDDTIAKSNMLVDSVGTVIVDNVITAPGRFVYSDWSNQVKSLFDMLDYPVCDKPDMSCAKKYIINDL